MNLKKQLQTSKIPSSKPLIFDIAKLKDRTALEALLKAKKIAHIIDDFEEQERELFAIQNPTIIFSPQFGEQFTQYRANLEKKRPVYERGRWIYFPWISTLTHVLEDSSFQKVRTARNRELITEDEQKKFYNATIGIGGLSVGNSVALAIVLQGGGRSLRIADHDRLALSNTNRVRAGIADLGVLKTEMTARQIYLLNPYAKVELFSDGLNPDNIKKFCEGLDLIIDEMDDLSIKFLLRVEAKRLKLPILMAADNGDNAVIDIERYDLNPATPFFHGRMGKISYDQLKGLDKPGIGKMITKWVGAENITDRMQQSLFAIGKTIVSWPQLGGAALLNGSAVAYCARKVLNGQPLENNRALLVLDEKLIPGYHSAGAKKKRAVSAKKFGTLFGLS